MLTRLVEWLQSGHLASPWQVVTGTALVALVAGSLHINRSIQYDEAITLITVAGHPLPDWPDDPAPAGELAQIFDGSVDPGTISRLQRETDVHPPLHYWLLAAWRQLAGDTLTGARLLSLLLGVAAVAMFTAAMMAVRVPWAPAGGLLFALSPELLASATTVRFYVLSMALIAGLAWTLAIIHRRLADGGRYPLGLAALAGSLAGAVAMSHYLAVITAALLTALHLALVVRGYPLARRWLWMPIVAGLPGAVGGLLHLIHQAGSRDALLRESPGALVGLLQLLGNVPQLMAGERWPIDGPAGATAAGASASIIGAVLGIGLVVALHRWRTAVGLQRVAAAIALAGGAGTVLSVWAMGLATGRFFSLPRYVETAVPFAALTGALAIATLARWRPAVGVLVMVSVLALQTAAVVDMAVGTSYREGWRHLASHSAQVDDGATLVLIDAGYGRGMPACLVAELPPDIPVRVARPVDEPPDAILQDALQWRRVVTITSFREDSIEAIADILRRLIADHGYRVTYNEGRVVQLERRSR